MYRYCLLLLSLFFCNSCVYSQKGNTEQELKNTLVNDEPRNKNTLRIMFYNIENLFDTIDDPHKNDNEFLPEGTNKWNSFRFYKKLKNTYKVITAVGGWDAPEIIGFCEIENRYVLEQLISKTPLRNNNYEIAHYESPDQRGIDVGLIYRPDKFTLIESQPLQVAFENDTDFKTRDVLYVKGIALNKDTLHIFVNHWPSRRGGESESEPKRIQAASIVRNKIEAIFKQNNSANIIVMGDLNDYPDNRSINEILQAKKIKETKPLELANLMYEKHEQHEGSHKYQSHWGCLDQMIVSPIMLDEMNSLQVKDKKATIYRNDFLLKADDRYMGNEPFRTYEGPKYTGGFSDHLPVFLDITTK